MSIPRSVADVIQNHVTLEVEGIDRMYGPAAVKYWGGIPRVFRRIVPR